MFDKLKKKIYGFEEKLTQGQHCEQIVKSFLESEWRCHVDDVPQLLQRHGIDFIVTTPIGLSFSVEVKSDFTAAKTGNAYIETSVGEKPGWIYKSVAQKLFYYVPPSGVMFCLDMDAAKQRVKVWEKIFEKRKVQNPTYEAEGLLVALDELEFLATNVVQIERVEDEKETTAHWQKQYEGVDGASKNVAQGKESPREQGV